MNKVFIIGNGFDLAHNLKTRYSDFLLWYVNKIVKELNKQGLTAYESDLISIDGKLYNVNEFNSLRELNGNKSKFDVSVRGKHVFMQELLSQSAQSNWVDIEVRYYQSILEIYRSYEVHRYIDEKSVEELNKCFDRIKEQLSEYLLTVPTIDACDPSILHSFKTEMSNAAPEEVKVLVFNYTETVKCYTDTLRISKDNVIYIHGKLIDPDNPIIFGYGDEMDENYSKLENLNNNEILKNMKSFSYSKAINYQSLSRFLKSSPFYDVVIIGHSCGISDRVLLNSIFCRPNCNSIKIYYHKRSEKDNDYFEKTQEISRHFPSKDKTRMRDLIVPFPQSYPLSD